MRRKLSTFAKLVGLAIVFGHIGLTVAYNFPDNPLRQRFAWLLDATVGTYFQQNWRLFAPEPASADTSIVVGCVDGPNAARLQAAFEAGEEVEWDGQWVDITAPLWTRHQQARLSAYDRISRHQANAARAFLHGQAGFESWFKACANGQTEVCERIDQLWLGYRVLNLQKITRVASSYCRSMMDEPVGLALRIRERAPVPWSDRFFGVAETADADLGFIPIDADVDPAPVYTR